MVPATLPQSAFLQPAVPQPAFPQPVSSQPATSDMPPATKRRKQSKPAEEATQQSSTDERADSEDATSPDESTQSSRQEDPRGGGGGSRDNNRSHSYCRRSSPHSPFLDNPRRTEIEDCQNCKQPGRHHTRCPQIESLPLKPHTRPLQPPLYIRKGRKNKPDSHRLLEPTEPKDTNHCIDFSLWFTRTIW